MEGSEADKHYENAEIIREKIYSMYKEMVESIRSVFCSIDSDHFSNFCFYFSDAHLKPFQDEIEAETSKKIDMSKAIDVFKTNLYASIEQKLNSSWDELEVEVSLASLSYAKEAATDESKKWRPSADVEDTILPTAIAVKKRTKLLFEKQLKYQTKQIEQLVIEVEQVRGKLRLQEERSKNVMEQIKRHQEKDKKVAEQIDSIYSIMADISGVEKGDSWVDKKDT